MHGGKTMILQQLKQATLQELAKTINSCINLPLNETVGKGIYTTMEDALDSLIAQVLQSYEIVDKSNIKKDKEVVDEKATDK
jgi:hypothetical protein